MCPYTLDHNKMLASTMQHSTHNHTPTPPQPPQPHPTHRETDRVRPTRPGAAPRKTPHQQVSPQDPTACQACSDMFGTKAAEVFHPATPTPCPPTGTQCLIRRGISERRDTPQRQPPKTTATITTSMYRPHQTVRLLRKEVIQPHLPVRLPCYDFVPIASPTFDDSPPQVG